MLQGGGGARQVKKSSGLGAGANLTCPDERDSYVYNEIRLRETCVCDDKGECRTRCSSQLLEAAANFGKIFVRSARQQILNQIFENP